MGLRVEVVRKPAPEKVMIAWAKGRHGAGKEVDRRRLMPPREYAALPRRWVVERTSS